MIILGLDVSSVCCGWAIMDSYGPTLISHGHIKPPPKDGYSIVERLDITMQEIDILCKKTKPDISIVEDITQYMANRTSANTIITLALFNRAVALQVYRSTGHIPLFLLPRSIRTRIKRFMKLENEIEKEDIPNLLQNFFGEKFFKIVGYKQRGKNKGKPIVEVYDEADACAAALAGLIELNLIKE
jgi:Holliday junction resolvasome RuvABC endonuclease subunit